MHGAEELDGACPLCGLGGRPRYRRDGMTPARQKAFIEALGSYGTVADAARVAGVSDTTCYRARKRMPEFARAWAAAKSRAAGEIETLAWERGVTGVPEPVFHYGKFSHVKMKRSDAIFRMIMMASNPDKYGRMGAGGVTPALIERLKGQLRAEIQAEGLAEEYREHEKTIEDIGRRLDAMRRHRVAESGYGETMSGHLIPPGYGPVSPDAEPLRIAPLPQEGPREWGWEVEGDLAAPGENGEE